MTENKKRRISSFIREKIFAKFPEEWIDIHKITTIEEFKKALKEYSIISDFIPRRYNGKPRRKETK